MASNGISPISWVDALSTDVGDPTVSDALRNLVLNLEKLYTDLLSLDEYVNTLGGGGGGGYTDEQAQDAVGLICIDTNSIDVTYDDVTPDLSWDVRVTASIAISGSGIQLVNDVGSPGNSYYYGTDAGGAKGWFPLSVAGGGLTHPQVLARTLGA